MMFSNGSEERLAEGNTDVLIPLEENSRVKSLKNKERYYLDKDGKSVSKAKLYQLRDGIFEAIIDRFYKDPTLAAWGEENRDWGPDLLARNLGELFGRQFADSDTRSL